MSVDFQARYRELLEQLRLRGIKVPSQNWQSQDVTARPGMAYSRELQHVRVDLKIPQTLHELQELVQPNLPWAEDHFQERVSGQPLNPPPSEQWWPYAQRGNDEHKTPFNGLARFSHTYPERIWPKHAARTNLPGDIHRGIRYHYGDLDDLVELLTKDILTRQAYLPIWFPEDTGAVKGQRVPCTLGYQFLFRPGYFPGEYFGQIVYFIRSCDLLRHFTDDVYMACRLLQWVVGKLQDRRINAHASSLIMHVSSLHTFEGDDPLILSTLGAKHFPNDREDDEDDPLYGF